MKPAVIAAIVAGVIAVGVVVYFVTGGNNGPLGPIVPGTGVAKPGSFIFEEAKPVPIATAPGQKPSKYEGAAKTASDNANTVLNMFYTEAFLDPGQWSGTYDKAFTVFDGDASAKARSQLDALTAGSSAGDTFEKIVPVRATLKTHVLIDARGHPISIVAIVNFIATGTTKSGPSMQLQSSGSYFLRQVGGAWKIVSFEVKRNDHTVTPSPTPSGSPSGSASGSPS